MNRRPHVVVLAGPNGAGKSTTAPVLLRGRLGVDESTRIRSPEGSLPSPQKASRSMPGASCSDASNSLRRSNGTSHSRRRWRAGRLRRALRAGCRPATRSPWCFSGCPTRSSHLPASANGSGRRTRRTGGHGTAPIRTRPDQLLRALSARGHNPALLRQLASTAATRRARRQNRTERCLGRGTLGTDHRGAA